MSEIKNNPKQSKKDKIFGFAIASAVFFVVGVIMSIIVFSGLFRNVGTHVLDVTLPKVVQGMWKGMVREFFTFIFFVIAVMFVAFALLIWAGITIISGPFFMLLALIFAIIQIAINRKWYSFVMLGLSIAGLFISFILLIARVGSADGSSSSIESLFAIIGLFNYYVI